MSTTQVPTPETPPERVPGPPKKASRPRLKPVANPVKPKFAWHRLRRVVQGACVVIFVALPFFDVMRFDIPKQRFYFAGQELWINEFGIIFLTLMFLMFVIVAMAMLYGRVYCGYLCPQMIFSEMSLGIEHRLRSWINKRFIKVAPKSRQRAASAAFYVVIGVVSVGLAFVFISYFVEPRDLLTRLIAFDLQTYGGIAGATTTIVAFLDFAFVRQHFCTTVCPYGYLQGMLGDDNTLIVEYRDADKECIECKKCVRVCHMGIDIRTSPYQIECIHCGECVDACADIMARFGKQTLIHYAWGEKGELLEDHKTPWHRRLGLRDFKRVAVLAILLVYASALVVALSMRHAVLVRISPVRTSLYRVGDDGTIYNTFRMTLANRSSHEATLDVTVVGLPEARIEGQGSSIRIAPGDATDLEFDIAVPPGTLAEGVNHFEVVSHATPDGTVDTFPMTFITPTQKGHAL